MLQIAPKTLPPEQSVVTTQDALLAIRALIWRQLPLMLLGFLVCIVMAGAYLLTAPPRFTSTAVMIIDSRKTQLLQQQASPLGVDAPLDSATVDSQVEILKSEKVALAVIKDLDLIHNPEFVSSGVGLLSPIWKLFYDPEESSEFFLTRSVLIRFEKELTIKRRGLSYVIEISYRSKDRDTAARVANAVPEAYIVDSLEAKYQATRRAAVWLQDRMKELRAQASTADRAVVDFKAKNNIVDTGGRLLNEQQLAETNSALTIARAQTAEAQARFDRLSSILKDENRDVNALFNDIATVADSLRNEVITRLRQQYLDLAGRESDWSKRYGAEHLAVVNLRNQMREIRRSISDELRRIGETYKSDLAIAKARENSLQSTLNATIESSNDTSQAQIILRDLESNAQSSRALADNFLQLYMMSVQQQSFPMTDARLITEATPPLGKSDPKNFLVLLGAMLGGTIIGFCVGWLRDLFDRVFRTGSDVEAALKLHCIAVAPMIDVAGAGTRRAPPHGKSNLVSWLWSPVRALKKVVKLPSKNRATGGAGQATAEPGSIAVLDSVMRHVQDHPFSRYTEAIRSIKVAVDVSMLDSKSRVLGFTSALPNEGKTTISASLAQVLAQSGSRVILVDADLRNPSLSRSLTGSVKAKQGLIEVVSGQAALEDAILTDPVTRLAFLPTFLPGRIAHTSEILSSAAMAKIVERLREAYDWVILDLSPLAPVIDVRATSRIVDAYVLVIEWGRTEIDVIERAFKDAPMLHDRVMGAVLNKANMSVLSRYDSYRGNYYYNRYYNRYGYVD
jgi:succinoglycan biosynthesis transport protein ExoP